MDRCDGDTIPEPSIWAGKLTPDLNGEKRFLRGNTDGNVLNLEEDQMQDHKHIFTDPGHGHPFVDKYMGDGPDNTHLGPTKEDYKGYRWDASHNVRTSNTATGAKVKCFAITKVDFCLNTQVENVSGGRIGSETRPRNMNVIFIMG